MPLTDQQKDKLVEIGLEVSHIKDDWYELSQGTNTASLKEILQMFKLKELLIKDLHELVYLRHQNIAHDNLTHYYNGIIERYEKLLEDSKNA